MSASAQCQHPTPVVILGARSFAREVADLIGDVPALTLVGFVENLEPARCAETIDGLPVFWVDDVARLAATHRGICALGSTQRMAFIQRAAGDGLAFVSVVHPASRISTRSRVGEGTLVSPGVQIASHVRIGSHVLVNRGALIGHNTEIGDGVTLGPGVNIAGFCRIGAGAHIGMGAVVIERIAIGRGAVVAAGAVVTRDVPDRVMVAGMPARLVKRDVEGL
jgi:sugar O-acyltransferase (sialic acid O-acetyltransferase NeuD family)